MNEDLQAEKTLLGTVVQFPSVIPEIANRITSKDFFHPRNQYIFEATIGLFNEGNPVSPTSVLAELDRRQLLIKSGGAPYLTDLIQVQTTAGDADYYAGLVFNKSRVRRIHDLGTRLSLATELDADQAVEAAHRFVAEADLTGDETGKGFHELMADWEIWRTSEEKPIPTPWDSLNDEFAGGLHPGRLYIVGARPGAGKTVFGLNCAIRAAMAGFRAMIFELEMPASEVTSRILSAGAIVPLRNIVTKRLTGGDLDQVNKFRNLWGGVFEQNLRIDDSSSQTIESIMAQCRAQGNLDLVFIDYAGLLTASNPDLMRYQQVEWISKQAKLMARRLGVAVILACQLNRASENENRKPRMSDLRESGGLEADSDVIALLTRDSANEKVDIHIAKNRTGTPDTTVKLRASFEYARLDS